MIKNKILILSAFVITSIFLAGCCKKGCCDSCPIEKKEEIKEDLKVVDLSSNELENNNNNYDDEITIEEENLLNEEIEK